MGLMLNYAEEDRAVGETIRTVFSADRDRQLPYRVAEVLARQADEGNIASREFLEKATANGWELVFDATHEGFIVGLDDIVADAQAITEAGRGHKMAFSVMVLKNLGIEPFAA